MALPTCVYSFPQHQPDPKIYNKSRLTKNIHRLSIYTAMYIKCPRMYSIVAVEKFLPSCHIEEMPYAPCPPHFLVVTPNNTWSHPLYHFKNNLSSLSIHPKTNPLKTEALQNRLTSSVSFYSSNLLSSKFSVASCIGPCHQCQNPYEVKNKIVR